MNYDYMGLFFSCKFLQNLILNIFKEGSKLIAQNFQKIYLPYFSINLKHIAMSLSKKKGGEKSTFYLK